MKDIECPYCEKWFNISNDDGHGCDESKKYEQQCPNCEKNFVFTVSYTPNYSAEKAPCLNGGNHNWKRAFYLSLGRIFMRCSCCGEERNCNAEERAAL